jgi:hypothetical protein
MTSENQPELFEDIFSKENSSILFAAQLSVHFLKLAFQAVELSEHVLVQKIQ